MVEIETALGTSMKISSAKDELVSALAAVSRAVSTRSTVQVLSGILIRADDGRVELAATDMELSLRLPLEADVEGGGAVVVPGRLLVDLARLLPEGDVTLEQKPEEAVLEVTGGSSTSRLHTYSAEDFPKLPDVQGADTFIVDRAAFQATVARVSRAASRDESRPVLTGILVRFEGGRLVMAATDSYRLSVKETELEGDAPELEAIVPARALGELARLAADADELRIGVHENHVLFNAGDVWLTSRRIDGQFPNYKQLIPETFEHEVVLPRDEFLDVVRRTSVMAQRNSPLRLRFANGEVTVSAQTQDVGEARETLPVAFSGEELEIGFNPEFLRDGVESVESDEVKLKLISPLRPGLIRADDEDFSYLIMPIRLAG
ncbi:MAG TPA: DNA polymerase III subunit beta [Gaiellaceae bacterium]|nr:DNA polymerase III subunit beta [Gaiellaceae bacterium]